MGFMAMDYFRHSPLLALPVLALVIFMLVFVTVSLRAFLGDRTRWDSLANLPLQDARRVEEQEHHHA
jgi:hypothetical protein